MTKVIQDFYQADLKTDEHGGQHFLSQTSLRKEECIALYEIVRKFKPVKTLEIGFALGASALGIIAGKEAGAIKEKHIVLDPFQTSGSGNAGVLAIQQMGLSSGLQLIEEFSENFLTEAFRKGESYDFIFIDGNHTIGQAVTDAFLANKVLNPGGIIGIHDSLMFSTGASIRYLINDHGYRLISNSQNNWKNLARRIKYFGKLGFWYCLHVIPKIQGSIIFLQKRS